MYHISKSPLSRLPASTIQPRVPHIVTPRIPQHLSPNSHSISGSLPLSIRHNRQCISIGNFRPGVGRARALLPASYMHAYKYFDASRTAREISSRIRPILHTRGVGVQQVLCFSDVGHIAQWGGEMCDFVRNTR